MRRKYLQRIHRNTSVKAVAGPREHRSQPHVLQTWRGSLKKSMPHLWASKCRAPCQPRSRELYLVEQPAHPQQELLGENTNNTSSLSYSKAIHCCSNIELPWRVIRTSNNTFVKCNYLHCASLILRKTGQQCH
jgi:hypothetical protein